MEVGDKVTVTGKMVRDVAVDGKVSFKTVDLPQPVPCIYLGTKSRAVGRKVYGGGSDEPSELKRTGFVRLHYVQPLAGGRYRLPLWVQMWQIASAGE